MAKFDRNKVVTPWDVQEKDLSDLIGKKCYFSNSLVYLKRAVENSETNHLVYEETLKVILKKDGYGYPFAFCKENSWQFIYPVEKMGDKNESK